MPVRTTLSFTERHHRFLQRKVEEGVFASTSAAVAAPAEAYLPLEDVLDETTRLARQARRG